MFEAEFDVLLIGDEPAGIWLLEKYTAWRHSIGKTGVSAHLTFGGGHRPTWLSRLAVDEFALVAAPVPSLEWLTPRSSMVWDTATIQEYFPDLPSRAGTRATVRPTSRQWSALRYALRRSPELLDVAQALWKRLGRATKLHPEMLLWHALGFTDLCAWSPKRQLGPQIGGIEVDWRRHPLVSVRTMRDGLLKLEFKEYGTLVARQVIWNTSIGIAQAWMRACPELERWLPHADNLVAAKCLVPVEVRARGAGINQAARPLSFWLDADAMLDVDSEIWPIEKENDADRKETTLVAWGTVHAPIALESAVDVGQRALGRVHRLFPFLGDHMVSVYPSPALAGAFSDCYSESQRLAALDFLEREQWELYDQSSQRTEARRRGIFTLFPSLHAFQPYPVGPLLEARYWLQKRIRQERPKPEKPASGPSAPKPTAREAGAN